MLKIGTVINHKYRIDQEIGSGGMSNIYRGRDLNGSVFCFKEAKSDEDSVESLKEEAAILSRINHWGVPKFYEAFEWNGHFIIVMEFIQGVTLADLIDRRGPASEDVVLGWCRQMCEILTYLHSRRQPIIHRDIKPSNILLRQNGTIALIDFGIAREFKTGKLSDTRGLGTKGYAAPEQYGGMGQTDSRTDIYSFGATMFYLLCGKNPMDVQQEFPMVRRINPGVSAGIESVIGKATRTRPSERYQNAVEFAAAIDTVTSSKPAGKGVYISCIALAVIGMALVLYEAVIGIPHTPVFIIGGIFMIAAVSVFILKGGFRRPSSSVTPSSKIRGVFLQSRDDFGSGSLSGKSSGSIQQGEAHGVTIEDGVWFLATEEWASVIGRD